MAHPPMEHLIWIWFYVHPSKFHTFPNILKNGLKKDWIRVLSQYEKHRKMWFNVWVFGIEVLRDDYLNLKSIWYYEKKMKKGTQKWHNNDMMNVHMWVVHMFSFDKKRLKFGHSFHHWNSNSNASGLDVRVWTRQNIPHGCYTNVQRHHLSIVIMFDHHQQSLPMGWVITSWQMEVNLIQWLLPLKEWIVNENPSWKPSCFIVNDTLQQHHAI